MSERISKTILLCEDEPQDRLVRAYLEQCGLPHQAPLLERLVASRMRSGGNISWVMERFPAELHACRQRSKRIKTLLIVCLDADDRSLVERREELSSRVRAAGHDRGMPADPVAYLIPKRHIETWYCALQGRSVTEDEDCKKLATVTKEAARAAAKTLYAWARSNAAPGATCVPSLISALPEWRKIG